MAHEKPVVGADARVRAQVGGLGPVAWPGDDLLATLMDIRLYYEEAALALADHVPGAHQSDAWFYQSTEMGRLLRRFQATVKAQNPPFKGGPYLLPMYQQPAPNR